MQSQNKLTPRAQPTVWCCGMALLFCAAILFSASRPRLHAADAPKAPIHFTFEPIPFSLDSSESPQRHSPETMAGGVGVFDYDNDGNLDIFFTNGADIDTLKKTSPKFWNRLFHNNGDGTFTEVTEKAGLAGTGYDTGVAIGDFDNDGFDDIFLGVFIAIPCTTTMVTEPSPTSRKKPASIVPTPSTARSGRLAVRGST